MNAGAIIERLQGVRRSGNGWNARCPAHDDRNPSLSIREENGKILLHCFAGCTAEAVCVAAGIEMRDLFTASCGPRRHEPPIVRAAEREIADLRSRLTPRERAILEPTVIITTTENLGFAIARALALAVEGDLVQVAMIGMNR